MQHAIHVEQLKKSYGSIQAVKGISFHVRKGELFAFLGANGAGKSTTIDILCTLLKQDTGSAFVNSFALGKQDASIRQSIGVVFQDNLLDPLLTVKENIQIRASFYGLTPRQIRENTRQAIHWVDAQDFQNQRYGKLSGGQRRKADIARALVHTPSILFLDEPTTGLDPYTRQIVWNTLRTLQQQSGMTVFLTTHYMEEAAAADYAAVMVQGEIKAKGTPAALREAHSSDSLRLVPKEKEALLQHLQEMALPYEFKGGAFHIKLSGTLDAIPILNRVQPLIQGLEVLSGSMDDTFISITGGELEKGEPILSVLVNLVRRNNKLFFRDKASLFFSLLSALIVLGLYLLFLRRLNVASLEQAIGDAAYNVIDSWMFSGILAIITVSSTLGAFGTMVDDRYRKISRDFLASPVRRSSLTAGYILTSVIIGIVLFLIALGLCQIYMAGNGFLLLSPLEFLKLLGVLIITVFSSSALMFFLISFIKTLNAYSTASAIIGTLIGFVTGVYMPIGMFPESVQTVIKLIPPSHGAMLMRQIMTSRPIEAGFVGAPAEALAEFRTQMGIDFVVGGEILPAWISILFLLAAGFLFFCLGLLKMRQKEK